MRNLVTGGAGFIGSWLVEHLLAHGEQVHVIDNTSTGTMKNLQSYRGNKNLKVTCTSVLDEIMIDKTVRDCDRVFHLAASVGVSLVMTDPVAVLNDNVNGGYRVMRACATHGKPILLASTSEVYGKSAQIPFQEDADVVYGPTTKSRWSYAYSKAVDEFFFHGLRESQGLNGVIVRFFNVTGPRQRADFGMVLPNFVKSAKAGFPLKVFGDGQQRRCFTHVADVVPALDKLMHSEKANGQVVNVGNDKETTILELAELVIDRCRPKKHLPTIEFVPVEQVYGEDFEEPIRRVPCLEKVNSLIGYEPACDLTTIIDDVKRGALEWPERA